MLVILGYLILCVDIYIGSVNVIPDLVGHLLIVIGAFVVHQRLRPPVLFYVPVLAAPLLHIGGLLVQNLTVVVILWILENICVYWTMRSFLGLLTQDARYHEEPEALRVKILQTCLLALLLISLFIVPVTAILPAMEWILLILQALLGLMTAYGMYSIFSKEFHYV